jgi:hypothetical protein
MKKKLPIAIRGILSTAILLLVAALLNTTPVQSAFPNAPLINPTLTLTKTVINDNGGTATQANFQAKIDGGDVPWDSPNSVLPDVQHTASETALVSGYSPSLWEGNCATDGTITLPADGSGTCSITNDDVAPSLTITKIVINDNGGGALATEWNLTASGPTPISGAGGATSDSSFVAGTYTLSETAGPVGYTSTAWICTGDGLQVDNEITLAVGETANCSITSDDNPPSLTLSKTVVNDNGGTALATAWTLIATGPTPIIGAGGASSGPSFDIGTYTMSETIGPAGYTPGVWLCTGQGTQVGNQITLALGESAICSIINDDISPVLNVIKNVINDDLGNLAPSNFMINVTGINANPISFPGEVSPGTPVTLNAGSYSVTETAVVGYNPTYSTDCTGEILVGETKTCIITNDDITPAIQVDPVGDLETEENGKTDSLSVVLTTIPTAPVSIKVSSKNELEGKVDKNLLNFNSSNWNIPQKVIVSGIDDYIPDGDINYEIELDPVNSIANEYKTLEIVQVSATNLDAPSIEWVKPVSDNEIYFIEGINEILLEVKNLGTEPIHLVQFYRWVPGNPGYHLDLGQDDDPPYQDYVDPIDLEKGYNEIRAYAYSPVPTDPDRKQTTSSQPYIFLLKEFNQRIYLPLINKNN